MPSTSSLASSSSSVASQINDAPSLTYPIRPDRDDASSGYDSPDDCETTTAANFEKAQQQQIQQ